jgi:hypothetical protein
MSEFQGSSDQCKADHEEEEVLRRGMADFIRERLGDFSEFPATRSSFFADHRSG